MFWNTMIGIRETSMNENTDRLCPGLKDEVKLEVLKAKQSDMDTESQTAQNVGRVFCGAGVLNRNKYDVGAGVQPMDIGNA